MTDNDYTPTMADIRELLTLGATHVAFMQGDELDTETFEKMIDRFFASLRRENVDEVVRSLKATSIVTLAGQGGAYEYIKKMVDSSDDKA